MIHCEVCGRRILGFPFKAIIEGARMLVCSECAKLGSISWEAKTEPRLKKIQRRLPQQLAAPRRQSSITIMTTLELIDGFGAKIRLARESLGLSHKDLGKKISEKASVLRKIESGKVAPDNLLTEKLQHALKIKLMVPVSEPKFPGKTLSLSRPSSTTLGDIMMVKKDKNKNADQ